MKQLNFKMTDMQNFSDAKSDEPLPKSLDKQLLLEKLFTDKQIQNCIVIGTNPDKPFSLGSVTKSVHGDVHRFYPENSGSFKDIGNLVGVLRGNVEFDGENYDVTLEIRSRFDKDSSRPWFLLTMMMNVFEEGELLISASEGVGNTEDFFQILMISYFISLFKRATQKGYYRSYIYSKHNDERFCGTLDIARHIRLNVGMNSSKTAYSCHERSYENAVNRLILFTWEYLKQKYSEKFIDAMESDNDFCYRIHELSAIVNKKSMLVTECIAENIKPISEPYYTEFEELRRLCLSILWDEGASCFGGSDFDAIKGVLIYIPGLWERYLEKQFYSSNKLKSMLQVQPVFEVKNCQKQWEHLEYVLHGCFSPDRTTLYTNAVKNIGNTIRPDFVLLGESGLAILILDAKHKDLKYLDNESGYPKLMRDQICYHLRQYLNPESNNKLIETLIREDYLNKVFIPLGGLVFPIPDKCTNYSEGLSFQTAFPVRIPQPDGVVDYLTWKKKLDGYICDTIKNIEEYMEKALKKFDEWEMWLNAHATQRYVESNIEVV